MRKRVNEGNGDEGGLEYSTRSSRRRRRSSSTDKLNRKKSKRQEGTSQEEEEQQQHQQMTISDGLGKVQQQQSGGGYRYRRRRSVIDARTFIYVYTLFFQIPPPFAAKSHSMRRPNDDDRSHSLTSSFLMAIHTSHTYTTYVDQILT